MSISTINPSFDYCVGLEGPPKRERLQADERTVLVHWTDGNGNVTHSTAELWEQIRAHCTYTPTMDANQIWWADGGDIRTKPPKVRVTEDDQQ